MTSLASLRFLAFVRANFARIFVCMTVAITVRCLFSVASKAKRAASFMKSFVTPHFQA